LRAEALNVLDAVNLRNPTNPLNAGALLGRITGADSPRVRQLALKPLF